MDNTRFCVYVIFSKKLNRFYVGTTDDFSKRLMEHNEKSNKGAFTSRGIPWELYLLIEDLSSPGAYQIEKHIKEMKSTSYIKNMKRFPEMIDKLKARYR